MKKNTFCKECPNNNCFIKKHCSDEWLDNLSQVKYQFIQKQGQYIFIEGNPVFGIYFIKDGKVKVTSSGHLGKEQIIRLATDGHILGHRGLGGDFYPVSAVSLEDTTLCFFENKILHEAFMANPEFTHGLMMFYSHELRKAEVRMKHLTQMNVREKTADAILFIREAFGLSKDGQTLNITISREEIAGLAGTSVGQIIHNLTDFQKEKIIAKKAKKIQILDEKKLAAIVSFYYS
jgi:CRP-like cAMP-binding protein